MVLLRLRKRLRDCGPVRFALVDGSGDAQRAATGADMEVVFASGERLLIGSAAGDSAILRTLVRALRVDDSPSGERTGVPVPDGLRHAEELRRFAFAGTRELAALLSGIDLTIAKRRKRYRREEV